MEELSIAYFRQLLDKNIKELECSCKVWEDINTDISLPEEVCAEIRTTIGLANLLMRQKLKQFGGLIDDSEFKRGEKEITCVDLQGFWDMVYHEVEKIQNSFKNLGICQKNNWIQIQEPVHKSAPKKKPVLANTAKVAETAAAKTHALAARQRLAEAKLKMKAQLAEKRENTLDIEVRSAIIDSHSENASEEIIHINEICGIDLNQKPNCEDKTQLKHTLKNIENLQISGKKDIPTNKTQKKSKSSIPSKKTVPPQDLVSVQNKKQRYEKTVNTGKENTSVAGNKKETLIEPDEKLHVINPILRAKKGILKDAIPLQVVTRSARRAMLAKQND